MELLRVDASGGGGSEEEGGRREGRRAPVCAWERAGGKATR